MIMVYRRIWFQHLRLVLVIVVVTMSTTTYVSPTFFREYSEYGYRCTA